MEELSLASIFAKCFPIFVLVAYSFFGGWLFLKLEGKPPNILRNFTEIMDPFDKANDTQELIEFLNNDEQYKRPTFEVAYKNLLASLAELVLKNRTKDYSTSLEPLNYSRLARKILNRRDLLLLRDRFANLLDFASQNVNFTTKDDCDLKLNESLKSQTAEYEWNLWDSIFYSVTIYTTIGYGNITPKTRAGQVCTMIYAMIGIPLVLAILRMSGNHLYSIITFLHNKISRFCRKNGDEEKSVKRRTSNMSTFGGNNDIPADLPLSAVIGTLIFWMFGCSAIFLLWEKEWDYFTSFYFFFITTTTIGLGDVVPSDTQYALLAFVFVLIGLSVVSMSFNVLQMKGESLFTSLMGNIDAEYKKKQTDPESGGIMIQKEGENERTFSGGFGVMQLYRRRPLREKILYTLLMDSHKKKMLEEYWTKKACTKNKACQTISKVLTSINIQCDLEDEEMTMPDGKPRMYIYNLRD